MKLLFKLLLVWAVTFNAAAATNYWDGDTARFLTDKLGLKNDTKIFEAAADPTSVATSAPIGSIAIFGSNVYIKQDAGSSTNWSRTATTGNITITRELILDPSKAEIPGVRYQTYSNASTYINTVETPTGARVWNLKLRGTYTSAITLEPYIHIQGDSANGRIQQSVTTDGVDNTPYAYKLDGVAVYSVDAAGATQLIVENSFILFQLNTVGTGTIFLYENTSMGSNSGTGANVSSLAGLWVLEGANVRIGNFSTVRCYGTAYVTFLSAVSGNLLENYGAGCQYFFNGDVQAGSVYLFGSELYNGSGTNDLIITGNFTFSQMINTIQYGVNIELNDAAETLQVIGNVRGLGTETITQTLGTLSILGSYFDPSGNLISTDTVSAIKELDLEKKRQEVATGADPTINDDSADGYLVGQIWVNTTSNAQFILVDNTVGAAIWSPVINSLAGSPLTTKGDLFTYDTGDQRLPVGTDGQLLSANSATATGLQWIAAPSGSPTTTKGDIIVNDGGGAASDIRLAVGTNNQALIANSATATGLEWQTIFSSPLTTDGDIMIRNTTDVRLPIGTTGQRLEVSAGGFPVWSNAPPASVVTTKGDLYTYDTAEQRLAVGTDGQVLSANSAIGTGLQWVTPYSDPITTQGDIIIGNVGGNASRLAIGTNNQILISDGTTAAWAANPSLTNPMTTNGDIILQAAGIPARLGVGTNGQVLKVTAGVPVWGTDSTSTVDVNFTNLPAITVETSGYDFDGEEVFQCSFDPHDFADGSTVVGADTSTSPELIANFDWATNDLTDWTNNSSGTSNANVVANVLILQGGGGGSGAVYPTAGFPVVAGKSYVIDYDMPVSSNLNRIDITTSPGGLGTTRVSYLDSPVGQSVFTYVAVATETLYPQLANRTNTGPDHWNYFSIKEAKVIKELVSQEGNIETATGKYQLGGEFDGTNKNHVHVNASGELILTKKSTSVAGGRAVVRYTLEP